MLHLSEAISLVCVAHRSFEAQENRNVRPEETVLRGGSRRPGMLFTTNSIEPIGSLRPRVRHKHQRSCAERPGWRNARLP
jgi:hypothetical protein